jgi:hypothetical protein
VKHPRLRSRDFWLIRGAKPVGKKTGGGRFFREINIFNRCSRWERRGATQKGKGMRVRKSMAGVGWRIT